MAGFFDTDGRLNRGRFAVQYIAFILPASLFAGLSNTSQGQLWPLDIIAFGIMLFTIFPIIKRFHDLGHSGWWSLTTMIPLVAFVPIIYLLFWRGTVGPNQYGHDPLGAAKDISPRARPVEPAKSAPHPSGPPSITPQATSPIPANLPTPSISPSHTNTLAAMSQDLYVIDEEAIYEQVANEIESGNVRKGLWTRLWADLDGSDDKVKLAYIRTRVAEIRGEMEAAQRAAAQVAQEREREETERHYAEIMKIETILEQVTLLKQLPKDQLSEMGNEAVLSGDERNFWGLLRMGRLHQVWDIVTAHPDLILAVDFGGNTPLHIAVKEGFVELAKLFLSCGADPDKTNTYGTTPRMIAARYGSEEMEGLF